MELTKRTFPLYTTVLAMVAHGPLFAQQIDISLHETTEPDSFEVRLTSVGVYDGLPNGTFTIRWEVAAEGIAQNADLAAACGGYSFANYGGTLDVLNHRYFTINFFGDRPLEQAGCAIGPQGMSLGGVRIRELTGCRNVELVDNGFVQGNNFSYYISIGGSEQTGAITSGGLSSGNCPPCEPAVITGTAASTVPYCGNGLELSSTASGSSIDVTWYDPLGEVVGWLPQTSVDDGTSGTYTVVVSNLCGADTATVEAVLDTAFCEAPTIDSAWVEVWEGSFGSPPGILLNISLTGSCLSQTWIGPWGGEFYADPDGQTTVPQPPTGNYVLIAVNDCGSDTVELLVEDVPPGPCVGPTIVSAGILGEVDCQLMDVEFYAIVDGIGPFFMSWYAPNGVELTASTSFTLPDAPWGYYTFIAQNICGADTMLVFNGPADTTGIAACQPPQIYSVGPSYTACSDDTLELVTSTFLTGPCATTNWSNVQVLAVIGDTTVAYPDYWEPIVLTLTNACGQTSATIPVEVLFNNEYSHRTCTLDEPLSLDAEFGTSGGQWFHQGTPHSGLYDPQVDTSGVFQYEVIISDGSTCPVLISHFFEHRTPNAGADTAILVCASEPLFELFPMLGGEPETGGNWRYNGQPTDSGFDPANDEEGVYTYRRTLNYPNFFACSAEADLTISVVTSITWYADTDQDGLGDPAVSIESCDPQPSYLTNADDACPALFGTIGDVCDDGDPETESDVINEVCVCAGDLANGVRHTVVSGLSLWPNPSDGRSLFLQLPKDGGSGSLEIIDAAGRVVFGSRCNMTAAPLRIETGGMALGSYSLRIRLEAGAYAVPFIVQP